MYPRNWMACEIVSTWFNILLLGRQRALVILHGPRVPGGFWRLVAAAHAAAPGVRVTHAQVGVAKGALTARLELEHPGGGEKLAALVAELGRVLEALPEPAPVADPSGGLVSESLLIAPLDSDTWTRLAAAL